jgi:hypothetical protein
MLSNSNLMCIRLLTSPFWSGTGISLKEDASVISIQAGRRSRSKLLFASENCRDYRIDVCRVTKGGTMTVCDTTWKCMSLCNCSHQFCKNIPVSFDFITAWNQGVFLYSPCISLWCYMQDILVGKEKPSLHCQDNLTFWRLMTPIGDAPLS